MSIREKEGISMTDKEYIKGLLEEINTCDKIISKYEELTNDYKHEIERLNSEYSKAFERLKSQQREIDRLKEENEFLDRLTTENFVYDIKLEAVKEFAEKLKEKALSHCRIINCYELTFIETAIDELLEGMKNEI